jgi:hypothetical protein
MLFKPMQKQLALGEQTVSDQYHKTTFSLSAGILTDFNN